MPGTPRSGVLLLLLMLCAAPDAAAQIVWDGSTWNLDVEDYRLQPFEGKHALYLQNGVAWLDGAELEDGVIEFDMHVPDAVGFHGLAFRAVDEDDYEHFYLRPHNSDRPDATQYTPVFNGVSGWQIYSDNRFALPVEVPVDRWFHVEVRVRGGQSEVYVEGQQLAYRTLLRSPVAGSIGLTSGGAPARFANVRLRPGAPEMETESYPTSEERPPGLIRHWRVSVPFAESRLDSLGAFDPDLARELDWDPLEADVRGIANLAKLRTRSGGANTVVAAVTLRSSRERMARLRFGFSDRVHVYLNGRPLYRGADRWRSRDYKFLGTIGLHDELVLPLRAGENELWLAVSEDFGGWGVTAQLVDGTDVVIASGR